MNAIICNETAIKCLDRRARVHRALPKPLDVDSSNWAYTKRQLKAFDLERFRYEDKPIDILIPSYLHHHAPNGFRLHRLGGEIPDKQLLNLGDGIITVSPLLAYVMMCRHYSLVGCIKIGFALCAEYSLEPSTESGRVDRFPLASSNELKEFIHTTHSLFGLNKAREAAAWVLDGSASPKETDIAVTFYLPKELGGQGFIAPKLNYKIDLSPEEQKTARAEHFRVDVCWPDQGIGFEYNSYSMHSDPHKIGEDERRRLVLRNHNMHVELITKMQLDDPAQVEILSRMLESYGVPRVG